MAPQCIPADATGGGKDIFRHKGGTILYQNAGKADFVQTGEMVLVGRAWKIIDAPSPGHAAIEEPMAKNGDGPALQISEEIKPLLAKLQQIDESIKDKGLSDPATAVRYNLGRAEVLEKIVAKSTGRQQEDWTKQLADCLSAAAQNSPANDSSSYKRLAALSAHAQRSGSAKLAGYVAFREMSADYTRRLNSGQKNDIAKVQDYWRERLKKFVSEYPSADDAPDALLQLGMVSEFMGKESEAKNWYGKLGREYTASPLSKKAQGCLRRLEMEGKPIELAGPTLGTEAAFDISSFSGKVVVVYYWASWNGQCASDFNRLKALQVQYKSKGLELVCVNLDNNQMDAVNFLRNNNLDAVQLYQAGGSIARWPSSTASWCCRICSWSARTARSSAAACRSPVSKTRSRSSWRNDRHDCRLRRCRERRLQSRKRHFSLILGRIGHACLGKSLLSKLARIASAAGAADRVRIITTQRQ